MLEKNHVPIENKNSIFFSVITPNYNSGEKLIRAINSLNSNLISFEHIIIDDCSSDDSFSSVKKIRNDNCNLILLSNSSNSGPGACRNKGLEVAKGQYIIFLDADDYFLDNALDTLYNIVRSKSEIDVLLFKHYMLAQANHNVDILGDSDSISLIEDPTRDYLLDNIISSPWCKCIRADLAKSFRFPDLRVSEDALYNLDIFINAKKVFKIDSTLYIFDKTESNSLTRKAFDRKEFMNFHKGWIAFEDKAFRELQINNVKEIVAGRKIRFEALYYIDRMVIDPNNKKDRFIIGFIRKTIRKNIVLARNELNLKIKTFCFLFYFFPSFTMKLLKIYKVL